MFRRVIGTRFFHGFHQVYLAKLPLIYSMSIEIKIFLQLFLFAIVDTFAVHCVVIYETFFAR